MRPRARSPLIALALTALAGCGGEAAGPGARATAPSAKTGPDEGQETDRESEAAAGDLLFGARGGGLLVEGKLWFQIQLFVVNDSDRTVSLSEAVPVLEPRGFTNAELEGDGPFVLLPDRGFALRGEIPAGGVGRAEAMFVLPVSEGRADIHWSMPIGIGRMELFFEDLPGVQLTDVPDGVDQQARRSEGRSFHALDFHDVAPGEAVAFAVRGLPQVAEPSCKALRPALISPTYELIPADGRRPPPEARDFAAEDESGKSVRLSDFRRGDGRAGKVVLVHFWASWCVQCGKELPQLEALKNELGAEVEVLALSSDEDWTAIRSRLSPGTPLTVLHDPPSPGADPPIGTIAADYGTEALPETYVVDRDGGLRYYFKNSREWDRPEAEACIRSLL